MSVKINVKYVGGLRCEATHIPSNASLKTDAPIDNGGKGEEFSPTDLVAVAFGTCTMTIMGMLAERSSINLEGATIQVIKEMTSHPSRMIGKLIGTITFPKSLNLSDVDKQKLEKAFEHCPVKQSLHPDVKIEMKFVYL